MPAIPAALYQFTICLILAKLEIHIEGKHGWAEKLPTWRWGPKWYLKLTNGKPLTGYHVWMLSLLLLLLHRPLLDGYSWPEHARILSVFFQFAFVWDFLWFLLNPAYGWRRFGPGKIWWFKKWLGPFPLDYYTGLAASLGLAATGGILPERGVELAAQVPFLLAAAIWARLRCRS